MQFSPQKNCLFNLGPNLKIYIPVRKYKYITYLHSSPVIFHRSQYCNSINFQFIFDFEAFLRRKKSSYKKHENIFVTKEDDICEKTERIMFENKKNLKS